VRTNAVYLHFFSGCFSSATISNLPFQPNIS